jgi:hypothetical protein
MKVVILAGGPNGIKKIKAFHGTGWCAVKFVRNKQYRNGQQKLRAEDYINESSNSSRWTRHTSERRNHHLGGVIDDNSGCNLEDLLFLNIRSCSLLNYLLHPLNQNRWSKLAVDRSCGIL